MNRNENARGGISADTLKLIAMITMAVDHVGAVLFPRMLMLRAIGRLAFPIYMWLLVEGFAHTSSRKKYMGRMAIFALLSELPFDLALSGRLTWRWQNIYFSLLWALLLLMALEKVLDAGSSLHEADGGTGGGFGQFVGKHRLAAGLLVLTGFMIPARLLHFDYGCTGPVLAAMFYLYFRTGSPGLLAGFLLFSFSNLCTPLIDGFQKGWERLIASPAIWDNAWQTVCLECVGVFAILFIGRYNGVRKWKRGKLLFYLFYPLHLLLLYAVRLAIG